MTIRRERVDRYVYAARVQYLTRQKRITEAGARERRFCLMMWKVAMREPGVEEKSTDVGICYRSASTHVDDPKNLAPAR